MTNKIRDKNVGSIEKISQTSDKNIANIENDANTLKELAKKLRETSKINRYISLGKKIKETNKYYIMSETELIPIAEAIEEVLAEREQDKKRIKELEEENAMLKKADNIARDVNIEEVTEVMNKSYEEFMSNYINKQVVIDRMEELKLSGGSNGKDNIENLVRELTIDILQELLEGEK